MTTLFEYLKNLNSSETQWGVWVNPTDLDDYRIGQYCFENGGILDDFVCIGSLHKLSYGFQSHYDALKEYLKENQIDFEKASITYKGKEILVSKEGILTAYGNGILDKDFEEFLDNEIEDVCNIWASLEAEAKIDELQEYFAQSGEFWKEQESA